MSRERDAVGPAGWATWQQLTGRVSPTTVRSWVRSGRLVRRDSGLYVLPSPATDWRTTVAALLVHRDGVASHATALALWDLIPPPPEPVHVSVTAGRSGRGSPGVVVHRCARLDRHAERRARVPLTSVERSLVDAWGDPRGTTPDAVRGAAITAVRGRMCSPDDLARELDLRPQLRGRRALAELVRLLADGCRSELELWGCTQVLRAPGMPPFTMQREIVVGGEKFVLDAVYEEVLLAVEMDGAAWHGSRRQRERDIRRDALVATQGWQTLRFSHARLTGVRFPVDPVTVRDVPRPGF